MKRYMYHQDSISEKPFLKQFCLRREDLGSLKYRRYSRYTFNEITISNSPKFTRAKFLENDDFCFVSMNKFGRTLSEFQFRCTRFILLVLTKGVIRVSYGSSTSWWKPWSWVKSDLIFTIRDIYINSNLDTLTKFGSNSRRTECKDITT